MTLLGHLVKVIGKIMYGKIIHAKCIMPNRVSGTKWVFNEC